MADSLLLITRIRWLCRYCSEYYQFCRFHFWHDTAFAKVINSPLNLQLSFDNTTNQDVFEERKTAVVSVQTDYNNKWVQHDGRMDQSKLPQEK